ADHRSHVAMVPELRPHCFRQGIGAQLERAVGDLVEKTPAAGPCRAQRFGNGPAVFQYRVVNELDAVVAVGAEISYVPFSEVIQPASGRRERIAEAEIVELVVPYHPISWRHETARRGSAGCDLER